MGLIETWGVVGTVGPALDKSFISGHRRLYCNQALVSCLSFRHWRIGCELSTKYFWSWGGHCPHLVVSISVEFLGYELI